MKKKNTEKKNIMSGRCKACDLELDSFDDPELCKPCLAAATESDQNPFIDEYERIVNVEEIPAFEQFPEEDQDELQ